MDNFCCQ